MKRFPSTQLSVFFFALLLTLACKQEPVPTPTPDPDPSPTYTQYGQPLTALPAADDWVLYEVNLRAFSPAGNLQGVTARIDEIAALGVNVLWLMPIYPIGAIRSVNSPYSIADYKAVNPELGDLEDLRALSDAAHARGMVLVLDWVANHTAWDHPWIDTPSWYTQDNAGNIIHPAGTNWQDVADLNFSNPNMRQAMIDAMRYWVLEANVDGYRCDAADFVPADFWRQAIDSLRDIPGRHLLMLAEGARNDHHAVGFDLTFGWAQYQAMKDVYGGQPATRLFDTHTAQYSKIPAGKHELRFITNHDESAWDATPPQLFDGLDGAFAAAVANTFLGGVPLIYGSQEVGQITTLSFFTRQPIDWSRNPVYLADYQRLMSIYTGEAAARTRDFQAFRHNDVLCFTKTTGSEVLACLVNLRGDSVYYPTPAALRQAAWTDTWTSTDRSLDSIQAMGPYDFLLLRQ
ncbi:MAG: alpha-amylase family glycosyl hydrolase [Bacteroidia bacterium]